jgi:hypothetical protein
MKLRKEWSGDLVLFHLTSDPESESAVEVWNSGTSSGTGLSPLAPPRAVPRISGVLHCNILAL